MTIHLPPDLENSIRAEVMSGHFASEAEMEAAAMRITSGVSAGIGDSRQPGSQADPAHKPIWEVFQELSAGVPDEVWISCRPTYPSSMTITSTAPRSGQPDEAGFCRFALLDRPFPPTRPMACCRPQVEPGSPPHRDRHHR